MLIELTILQTIILGIIQGITEWIPISSSAALVWAMSNFFNIFDTSYLVRAALFFHFGTFFAALVYFRKDVFELIKSLSKYKYSDDKNKKTLNFLIITTIISSVLGLGVIFSLKYLDMLSYNLGGKTISFFIGIMLLITGVIQLKAKKSGLKKERDLKLKDSVVLGFAQGAAAFPGLSRSGITISSLLLKGFDDTTALRLSFLMSLPIVFFGNIILNFEDFFFTMNNFYGLIASFVFGLLTIHMLMKLSKKINFGWFAIIFALLMMLSVFI